MKFTLIEDGPLALGCKVDIDGREILCTKCVVIFEVGQYPKIVLTQVVDDAEIRIENVDVYLQHRAKPIVN